MLLEKAKATGKFTDAELVKPNEAASGGAAAAQPSWLSCFKCLG